MCTTEMQTCMEGALDRRSEVSQDKAVDSLTACVLLPMSVTAYECSVTTLYLYVITVMVCIVNIIPWLKVIHD